MFRLVVICFVISKIVFFLFALIATQVIPLSEGYLGKQFNETTPYVVWIWANFDGRHFLSIATEGYQRTNFAYFPLFPALISLTGYVLPISHLILGILLSVVSQFFALVIIFKIISLDYKESIARLSIVLLSFFPLAFFYHSVYADSLFLLLTVTSFYFARQSRWLLSGIFCGLATATRLSAVSLIPALLVEWYLQNGRLNKEQMKTKFLQICLPALLLGSLGSGFYLLYQQIYFGDFLLFQKSMTAWRQNEFIFPLQVIWRYVKIFLNVSPSLLVFWIAVFEFVTFILYFATAIYVFIRVRMSYGVFMIALLLLVTFTGTLAGTPRYMLHLFPGFLAVALLIRNRRVLKWACVAVFIILGFVLTGLFTRGYFIA